MCVRHLILVAAVSLVIGMTSSVAANGVGCSSCEQGMYSMGQFPYGGSPTILYEEPAPLMGELTSGYLGQSNSIVQGGSVVQNNGSSCGPGVGFAPSGVGTYLPNASHQYQHPTGYQNWTDVVSPSNGVSTWQTSTGYSQYGTDGAMASGGCYSDATVVAPAAVQAAPVFPLISGMRGLFGGFEFLWMRASFDQNVALIIDPPVGNTLVPFDYDRALSPRAWLGWQSCNGFGVRATYFGFDEQANNVSVTAVAGATPVFVYVYGAGNNLTRNAQAVVGQTLMSSHKLNIQSWDIEATGHFSWCRFNGILGTGIRIADIDQFMRARVRTGAGVLEEEVTNDLDLSGAGPTASLQIWRCLGSSPLSVYSQMRGSLLMTETEQRIYEMKGNYTTELEDRAFQKEVITALEMGVGLQWLEPIGCNSHWFGRVGYECQAWFDAGGPVDSHSTIGLDAISFALGLCL